MRLLSLEPSKKGKRERKKLSQDPVAELGLFVELLDFGRLVCERIFPDGRSFRHSKVSSYQCPRHFSTRDLAEGSMRNAKCMSAVTEML
jgi:hypothetical protein